MSFLELHLNLKILENIFHKVINKIMMTHSYYLSQDPSNASFSWIHI